ncbi:MAG: YiiX/YebB-like N1pC/P60 family cysteine hydrolase, partial [Gammaproteobacteria bacterium]
MNTLKLTKRLIAWLNEESIVHGVPICDFERFRHELKPCDVILVEGRSRVSTVIRLITASPWTHAALYIGRIHDIEDAALRNALERYCNFPPNEQLIIESVLGKGTIVNQLAFYQKDHIRICRPTGLSYQDAQQVVRYAISRLGAEYDVRQIFDLARFLFPWILLPRRWRSSLFRRSASDSTTRTVCSTMIAEAFGFIQFPILPLVKKIGQNGVQLFRRNPKICVPSDFDYSPHFEIIKYPFIDLGLHKDYRLLPWKGSGQLSPEEAKLYFEHSDSDYVESQ